jgi:PhnB protein
MPGASLNPYLMFDGNAREAMEFYHDVLGGDLKVQTFSEVPDMPAPPGYERKVMHAQLDADGVVIMASDPPPGSAVTFGDNVNLSLVGNDNEKLTRVFNDLSAGGKVTMPLGRQFWGDTFGSFTDRFGVNWMVNISDR